MSFKQKTLKFYIVQRTKDTGKFSQLSRLQNIDNSEKPRKKM